MARLRYPRADQADSDCTPGADANKPMLSTETGGGETVTTEIDPQASMASNVPFSFTTASGDPGGSEDLGASSVFTFDWDITVIDSPAATQARLHGTNAGCTSLGNVTQSEGNFTTIGVKTSTFTWDPPALDRWQVRIHASGEAMHGDPTETLTIATNQSTTVLTAPDAPGGAATNPGWMGAGGWF
jgi:hypothetical protein